MIDNLKDEFVKLALTCLCCAGIAVGAAIAQSWGIFAAFALLSLVGPLWFIAALMFTESEAKTK